MGRYVTTFNTVDEWVNYSPAGLNQFITTDTRGWTDSNQNYAVDCNLLSSAANGECGPGNPFFAKQVSPLTVDPATTDGWNTREYSWDLSAGVTHEVAPGVSVQVDYIRRSWGNLQATINRAWTPDDFDSFVYNVPADSRLPDGGGYPLTFYDVKPAKFQQIDNFLTFADDAGGAFNKFNGVDFTVNARLRDVTLQGGTSTGNVVEDSCGVVAKHPEFYIFGPWGGTDPFLDTFLGGLGQWPQSSCHRESGWKTNVKALATYTLPKIDVLISGTFRSLPTAGSEFPSVQSQSIGGQAIVAPEFETNLGRPLSSGNRHRVPEHREARRDVRRSPECRRSPVRQDPEVRLHQDAGEPRRLQPDQLEYDGEVPVDLRDDVSQSVVDHVGAVLQDQRAARFLTQASDFGLQASGGPAPRIRLKPDTTYMAQSLKSGALELLLDISRSVQPHQAGRGAFFGDLQIPPDTLIAHHVWIGITGRALRQQRQVDLRSVPVGVVRKDDVRSGLPRSR